MKEQKSAQFEIRRWAFSSKTYEYETPLDLFRVLDREFHFSLDVCANKSNAKTVRFFDKTTNGLLQSWENETCWMNPPYGKLLPNWMQKAQNEAHHHNATVVALVPCRTDTRWFWNCCIDEEIRLIKGRLRFKHGVYDGEPLIKDFGAPFPSMLVIFKPRIKKEGLLTYA